jgi:hypothetical protein
VFDRMLDEAVVIDASVRMSLIGIDLVTVEARIVSRHISHNPWYVVACLMANTRARLSSSVAKNTGSNPEREPTKGLLPPCRWTS